ncbi:MAG: hypothetical protein C0467_21150 [Planctomycetaceae bacterium]|nr:hypothetical protein [Planctomycetaceae bacterium]
MKQSRRWFLVSAAFAALTVASCESGPKRKQTFPTSGKVLLPDGRPAQHATVILHPIGDTDPNAVKPHGKVGPDGTFKLTTYETDDGAPAGEYKVTIELWLAGSRADEAPSNRLSPKLANPETSGLKATVNAAPTELNPFELKK